MELNKVYKDTQYEKGYFIPHKEEDGYYHGVYLSATDIGEYSVWPEEVDQFVAITKEDQLKFNYHLSQYQEYINNQQNKLNKFKEVLNAG